MLLPLYGSLAAKHGHLGVLKWLQEAGLELDRVDDLCKEAASEGHFAVLQWLHALGCPMNVQACSIVDVEVRIGESDGLEEVLPWLRFLKVSQPSAVRQMLKNCASGMVVDVRIGGSDGLIEEEVLPWLRSLKVS